MPEQGGSGMSMMRTIVTRSKRFSRDECVRSIDETSNVNSNAILALKIAIVPCDTDPLTV